MSVSWVWELYVPTEFAVGVYEQLLEAGAAFGLTNAGYYTINSLRLEKGYRAFGAELTPDHNPVEAGLLFAATARVRYSVPGPRGRATGADGRPAPTAGVVRARRPGADDVGR